MKNPIPLRAAITIILGRPMVSLGWIIFGFLLIFGRAFGGDADLHFIHYTGEISSTKGKVIKVEQTNLSINDIPVYQHTFEFLDGFGERHESASFTTGYRKTLGQQVAVEYPFESPKHARIPGMRSGKMASWAVVFWLLPVFGALPIIIGIQRGIRDYLLLGNGKFATAKLIDKQMTNAEYNHNRIYKLTFEYTHLGVSHHFVKKTHDLDKLMDDEHERIFYNPNRPKHATLVDNIPCKVKVEFDGTPNFDEIKFAYASIIWPVLCIGPHIIFS